MPRGTISLAEHSPDIAKEWHPTLNGDLTPWDVSYGTKKNYWWKCLKEGCDDHEWKATVGNRTGRKSGCACCDGKKAVISNCLATLRPDMAKEWHQTLNGTLTPNDVTHGSNKSVWWRCLKKGCEDHEWIAAINARTLQNQGCACCEGMQIVKSNCLSTTHPEISKEWHPSRNLPITPAKITHGTVKKFWWKCSQDHEWLASPNDRTSKIKPRGCPTCKESLGEMQIEQTLTRLSATYVREKWFTTCRNQYPLPFDFAVFLWSKKPGLIEYQGEQHYRPIEYWGGVEAFKQLQRRDQIKRDWCKTKGVPLLEIPYTEYNNIPKLVEDFVKNRL